MLVCNYQTFGLLVQSTQKVQVQKCEQSLTCFEVIE